MSLAHWEPLCMVNQVLNGVNLCTTPFNWILGKIQFFENCWCELHFCRCEIHYTTFVSAFFCQYEIIWDREQQNNITPKFPCGICAKAVAKNHKAACCDICNLWVHIKCNNVTKFCYRKLPTESWAKYYKYYLFPNLPIFSWTELQIEILYPLQRK